MGVTRRPTPPRGETVRAVENFMAKKAAIQVEEQRERELAAERLVVPWGELRPNDYAFRGWGRGGEGGDVAGRVRV